MLLVNNNNNLHLYSADLYMDIFSCALQYCQIKIIMLKASKNIRNYLKAKLKKIIFTQQS